MTWINSSKQYAYYLFSLTKLFFLIFINIAENTGLETIWEAKVIRKISLIQFAIWA